MELDIQCIEIWEANIADQPGGLAHALDALDDAGVDIQFVVARRTQTNSGRGQVLVTPLRGDHQVAAGARAGFHVPEHIHAIRVSGESRTGLAAGLPGLIAGLGINLLGFTASTLGRKFVAYIAADSQSDVDRILQALRQR